MSMFSFFISLPNKKTLHCKSEITYHMGSHLLTEVKKIPGYNKQLVDKRHRKQKTEKKSNIQES